MSIDDLLREVAPDFEQSRLRTNQLRTRVLLNASYSVPNRWPTRRVRRGVAALAVGLGTFGGVAYAAGTGTVPPWVSSAPRNFARGLDQPSVHQPEMAQIVDLQLPDGSRFAAWSGVTDDIFCTAYTDNWDGKTGANGSGASLCGDGGPAGFALNRVQIVWAHSEAGATYYPVAFGVADNNATQVEITGTFKGTETPVELTAAIDPKTHAFAVALPGTKARPWDYSDANLDRASGITFTYEGNGGKVLGTVVGPPA